MHDATNQTENRHRRQFAREKTALLRWLETVSVKDGNTEICFELFIPSDCYRHVVSLCCIKCCESSGKHGEKDSAGV